MSLRTQLILLLSTLFIVVLINTFIVFILDREGRLKFDVLNRTHEIIDQSERLYNHIINAETGQRGYLLTENLNYLDPYYRGLEKTKEQFLILNKLTLNDKKQQQNLAQLDALIEKKFAELNLTINLIKQNTPDAAEEAKSIVYTNEGKALIEQIEALIKQFQNVERTRLAERNADFQNNRLLITQVVSVQIPLFIFLSIFCAFYINNKLFKPLKRLLKNTEKLEKGEIPDRIEKCDTNEIGYLLRRFHRMSNIIYRRTNKLSFLVSHDHLTGVLNRTELDRQLKFAISASSKNNKMAVIFIDINQFKQLNDQYGHVIGDKVLVEAAKRITGAVRADDDVYRYGGDEFIIVAHHLRKLSYIDAMIKHLLDKFNSPFEVEQHNLKVTLSIGIAVSPDHTTDHTQLLKFADQAMYEAKQSQLHTYKIFQGIEGDN
ncbi:diguanylate cyclase domain-containing protein [Pseudoalteromonas sp. JSTW]|uniref:diguanylate cyclase domain-containing protein n=1 Tax=Pseudoalteromonas sp. JSTW TaxID=2752475 RepID=UPI0015D53096|nr:diguanylate cyclase [Pseudoalteromonas sp. JSTW]QLJ07067.1 diguanylate cyclase [Pseudoalteromonas sp. JSTW]